jgi:hypothetical protein
MEERGGERRGEEALGLAEPLQPEPSVVPVP